MRKPDFNNLLKVLRREAPECPTLFEFFLNEPLYEKLAASEGPYSDKWTFGLCCPMVINACKNAGYDYAAVLGSEFTFQIQEIESKETVSLNAGSAIRDRKSFEAYQWPEPERFDYSRLGMAHAWLPDGMKLIVMGPRGVLENVLVLTGYEHLCMMLVDDPELARAIFDAVGSRLVRYYEICAEFDTVGALISNDDWGFKTQTMLAPTDMGTYVFPWHKKIVDTIHAAGKPAILHSCGNLDAVMDDIIHDMRYDAKHSFEDTIEPVEDAYERWGSEIAVLGGIDLDFICRSSPAEIHRRCRAMLMRTADRGGYALGTGNSIPEYVPDENFFAMIQCAADRVSYRTALEGAISHD
jgi:uroporphyrinogen decarboxylase